jgi:hypothetical protein
MQLRWIHAVICLVAVGFLAGANDTPMPTAPGGLIIIAICVARKREEIGGWLLLFHIGNYTSILISIPLLAMNHATYDPASWGEEMGLYFLFIFSVVPGLIWMPVQLFFAERLRLNRAKPRIAGELPEDRLRTLQRVLYVALGFAVVALVVDMAYFPDNVLFSGMAFIPSLGWALYFQFSKRVQQVYVTRDWGMSASAKAREPLDLVGPAHAISPRDGGTVGVPVAQRDQQQ